MSFVTFVLGFVSLLFFGLTYVISTSHSPVWLAFITFVLGMCLVGLTCLSWGVDHGDKLEDFTDGR